MRSMGMMRMMRLLGMKRRKKTKMVTMSTVWQGWIAALVVFLWSAGCTEDDQQAGLEWPTDDTTFVFTQPDAEFTLATELEEISGLTFMEDGMLGAIQDEDGDLYIIDPASGEVVDVRSFGEAGDYEGIELADSVLYILRSDGRVYSFTSWSAPEFQGEAVDHSLPGRCDAEGIAHQSSLNRMLIVCKEHAGSEYRGKKAVYAFDRATGELTPEPVYLIDINDFEYNVEEHPFNEAVRSVLSDRMDMSGFRPSALAVHPQTGDVLMLSTVTKSLLRLDESGEITALWMLPAELFDQPEGLAIDSNGDLYISNEAGDRQYATLLRFSERGAPVQSDTLQTTE